MAVEIGRVEAIFRYPVKSMRGEPLEVATLGWHGIEGDRRLAFRRMDDRSGFPWLSASRLPELLRYAPQRRDHAENGLPTHVLSPDGVELPIFGDELAAEVGRRLGARVEMIRLDRGIFDEASISVITFATVVEISSLAGVTVDPRRFRPNLVVRTLRDVPYEEDDWLGGMLSFGGAGGPAVSVTLRDARCAIVNLDPDVATPAPEVLKTVVRTRDNHAGVYGTVTRTGELDVGQTVTLQIAAEAEKP